MASYMPELVVSNVYSRTYGNMKRTPVMIKIEVHIPGDCVEAVEDNIEEVIDTVLDDAYAIEAEKHQEEIQNQIVGISRQEEVNEIVEMSREHFIERKLLMRLLQRSKGTGPAPRQGRAGRTLGANFLFPPPKQRKCVLLKSKRPRN